jgi:hypothetical protein
MATSLHILGRMLGFAEGLLAPILAFSISVIYFLQSPRTDPLSIRLLVSAHGVSIAALYIGAMLVWWTGHSDARFESVFIFLLVLPLVLIAVSFVFFRGNKSLHLLQALNILCLMWTAFVGGMAVTGDWL